MLLATAIGVGVATLLFFYFCSQKKERQHEGGTSSEERSQSKEIKVSVVQPLKQADSLTGGHKISMGNSQSDDVTEGQDQGSSQGPQTTTSGHVSDSKESSKRSNSNPTVSYSSGPGGHTVKCSVNSEDNIEPNEDLIDGPSNVFDSVDNEITADNTLQNMSSTTQSGISSSNKQDQAHLASGKKLEVASEDIVSLTRGLNTEGSPVKQKDGVKQGIVLKEDKVLKNTSCESNSTEKTCHGPSKSHSAIKSVGESLTNKGSLTQGDTTEALENTNNNTHASISTEIASHKYQDGNYGLTSHFQTGSSSNSPVQSTSKGVALNNVALSGDFNDNDTGDCKQGSSTQQTSHKESFNSEGESIDSFRDNTVGDTSPSVTQAHKSEKGILNSTDYEEKESTLSGDQATVIKRQSVHSNTSERSTQKMDRVPPEEEESEELGMDSSAKVVLRSKRKSPNKRAAFILPDEKSKTVGLLDDVIDQWISEQQLLIQEKSREDNSDPSPGSVYCSQIGTNCKLILTPGPKDSPAGQADGSQVGSLGLEPVPMSDKSCQTEAALDIKLGLVNGQGIGGETSDVVIQLKRLQEENQKLHRLIEQHSKSRLTATLQEENNNIESAPDNQEVASPETRATKEVVLMTDPENHPASGHKAAEEDTVNLDLVPTLKQETFSAPPEDHNTESVRPACISDNEDIDDADQQQSSQEVQIDNDTLLSTGSSRIKRDKSNDQKLLKKRESSFFDDLSIPPDSPRETTGGFSFDDILKANLEYLSDDDDLFGQKEVTTASKGTEEAEEQEDIEAEVETQSKLHTMVEEAEIKPDEMEITEAVSEEDVSLESNEHEQITQQDIEQESSKEVCVTTTTSKDTNVSSVVSDISASCKVSNSAKFWESKLTSIHRDRTVAGSGENLNIDSENIQKTKQLWEEKQSETAPEEEGDLKPSEFKDEKLTASIRETKMKWQERMVSDQNSGSNSSPVRSMEDLNNSSNGSDLEGELRKASKILEKKMMWEGMNLSPNSSFRGDSCTRRLMLDGDSEFEKKDVGKTKMKWEELVESKNSPGPARKAVQLISQSDMELELEMMSLNVEVPSISDVSNTKSKFEKMFASSDDVSCSSPERVRRSERRSQSPMQGPKNPLFSSLKEKFESVKKEDVKQGSSLDDVRRPKLKSGKQYQDSNDSNEDDEEDQFLSLTDECKEEVVTGEETKATETRGTIDGDNVTADNTVEDIGTDTNTNSDINKSDESKVTCDTSDKTGLGDVETNMSDQENSTMEAFQITGDATIDCNTSVTEANEEIKPVVAVSKTESSNSDDQAEEASSEVCDFQDKTGEDIFADGVPVNIDDNVVTGSQSECIDTTEVVETETTNNQEESPSIVIETTTNDVTGSSSQFCDSELEFMKESNKDHSQVDLSISNVADENTSEC